jgi:hypothetical protein
MPGAEQYGAAFFQVINPGCFVDDGYPKGPAIGPEDSIKNIQKNIRFNDPVGIDRQRHLLLKIKNNHGEGS